MHKDLEYDHRRILLIDDNPAIHQDFGKIFGPGLHSAAALAESAAALFGEPAAARVAPLFQLDSAFQGEEGLQRVCSARDQDRPYAMAFVDMRMPPGWDGLETANRIWERDADIQIVVCTAYSDHTWEEIREKLGRTDQLIILQKPFGNIEVLQLADALTGNVFAVSPEVVGNRIPRLSTWPTLGNRSNRACSARIWRSLSAIETA